ncbi:serine hydrolase domain-containing protein [Paludibaculum fermentans]|uniref:serine hydrolase domain-containing protein n=1 Tax=Paludibaculum fermentans TaxID=1473598 RepID=UPI003EBA5353
MATHRRRFLQYGAAPILYPFLARNSSAASIAGSDYYPPPDAAGGWRTLAGAERIRKVAGMDLDRLDQAFRYTATTSQHGGLLVARHGWLLYERYFGRAARDVTPNMYSIGKTVTSLCCGIVLDEHRNRIPKGLDQGVFTESYLPEAFPLADPRQASIKLGHLLTMTSGMREGNSGIVRGEVVKLEAQPPAAKLDQDQAALRAPMWTNPGGGYSYSSQGVHVVSTFLRHIVGMELQAYFDQKIARHLGFGGWGYAMDTAAGRLPHTPGGAGVALRATDALRYGYLMLREGNWMGKQLVPRDYMALCRQPSPYNVHSPYSLQFEVNADGHVFGAPRDTFFKSGAGGFCLYAVPSLDLVVYKLASVNRPGDYDLGYGRNTAKTDDARDTWAPGPSDQFHDGPINGDAGTRRTLEMVIAAITG